MPRACRPHPKPPSCSPSSPLPSRPARPRVAIEVSSHALDAGRVDGTRFAAGIFTNLSHEHLDHHGTLERYFAAKARLFEPGRCEHAVVNVDDVHGRRLLADLGSRADLSLHPFSLADATRIRHHAGGVDFRWRGTDVRLRLPGDFNVSNALAAATAAAALGLEIEHIAAGLAAATPVRGRFETVDRGQDFAVVVDFAHTPDALGPPSPPAAPSPKGPSTWSSDAAAIAIRRNGR